MFFVQFVGLQGPDRKDPEHREMDPESSRLCSTHLVPANPSWLFKYMVGCSDGFLHCVPDVNNCLEVIKLSILLQVQKSITAVLIMFLSNHGKPRKKLYILKFLVNGENMIFKTTLLFTLILFKSTKLIHISFVHL